LKKQNYFLVSLHREENVDSPSRIERFITILQNLVNEYQCPVVVSVHPRTRKALKDYAVKLPQSVRLERPFSFTDYCQLQISSKVVLSDSGTLTEESSILGFQCLNLRDVHERPEGMEEAIAMMVGLEPDRVMHGIRIIEAQMTRGAAFKRVYDYSFENVSDKVVRLVLSYRDFVMREVWKER
jgi:UDP-N-acetylglucosamine 2-epimerase (non-hydrolysing)